MSLPKNNKNNKNTKNNKDNKSNKDNKKTKKVVNYFITQSRLNRGQRKYCHCVMKLRASNTKKQKKSNPYSICKNLTRNFANNYQKEMKLKEGDYNPLSFDVNKTNCVMNYNYTNYSLKEIQALCLEKDIPITYKRNNKTLYYKKEKLIDKLIRNYLTLRKK